MTGRQWCLWQVQRSDMSGVETGQGTKAEMTALAARASQTALQHDIDGVAYIALPAGRKPRPADLPPEPASPPAAARTVAYTAAEDVTDAVVRVACAGDRSAASRANTARAVRALMDDGYRLVREDESRRARRSLAQAWGAWLDLMMSVSLPSADGRSLLQEALDFEPGLRRRFEEFLGGKRG